MGNKPQGERPLLPIMCISLPDCSTAGLFACLLLLAACQYNEIWKLRKAELAWEVLDPGFLSTDFITGMKMEGPAAVVEVVEQVWYSRPVESMRLASIDVAEGATNCCAVHGQRIDTLPAGDFWPVAVMWSLPFATTLPADAKQLGVGERGAGRGVCGGDQQSLWALVAHRCSGEQLVTAPSSKAAAALPWCSSVCQPAEPGAGPRCHCQFCNKRLSEDDSCCRPHGRWRALNCVGAGLHGVQPGYTPVGA